MNLKTTAILLSLFAIAIAALLVMRMDSDSGTPQPTPTKTDQPILAEELFGNALSQAAINYDAQGNALALERQNGRWMLTRPHIFPAQSTRVDELLTILAACTGYPIQGQSPTSDPIRLSIGDESNKIDVILGQRLGAGRAVLFIQSPEGIEAYNTPDTLHDWFKYFSPSTFYANKLDPLLMPSIARVHINADQTRSSLEQREGRWWINANNNSERALEQGMPGFPGVNDYFALLGILEAADHQTYLNNNDLAKFGLDKPLIAVRFVPLDADPADEDAGWTLAVGVPADLQDQTRYVSYGSASDPTPAVFTASTQIALAFGQFATNFRDPRIIATPLALIDSITLQSIGEDGQTTTLTINSGSPPSLAVPGEEASAISPSRFEAMLAALSSARASAYEPVKRDECVLIKSVLINPKLGGEPEPFSIYEDPNSQTDLPTVLIHRGEEPVVLQVQRSAVTYLLDPLLLVPEQAAE